MKRIASLLLAACLLAAPQLTGKAQAEGFALSDFGARGTALAGGMVARADDPSAVAWNPAGITQLPGTQIMVGMTAIQPSGTVDTVDRFGIGRSTDTHGQIRTPISPISSVITSGAASASSPGSASAILIPQTGRAAKTSNTSASRPFH